MFVWYLSTSSSLACILIWLVILAEKLPRLWGLFYSAPFGTVLRCVGSSGFGFGSKPWKRDVFCLSRIEGNNKNAHVFFSGEEKNRMCFFPYGYMWFLLGWNCLLWSFRLSVSAVVCCAFSSVQVVAKLKNNEFLTRISKCVWKNLTKV